ncbi:MAG TPA: hypothetical protein VHX62_00405 [Solirubrobacteraceae bacterium]|jgi:hypothetical protein|nr:hypothetical protein [Solirubrobacteraceae bacterium]
MESSPRLIVQVPRGGAVARRLAADPPASVTAGEVVVEAGPTDAEGRLEAAAAGEILLSLPSPEALARDADSVRRVIGQAGTSTEPILVVIEAAEELRQEELDALLSAAGHTARAVILRIIADA